MNMIYQTLSFREFWGPSPNLSPFFRLAMSEKGSLWSKDALAWELQKILQANGNGKHKDRRHPKTGWCGSCCFFFFFGAGSLRVGTATQDETDETTRIEEMLKDETLRSCKMLGGMDNCVQSNRFFWSFPILSGVWSWNLSIPGFDNWFSVALELPDIR